MPLPARSRALALLAVAGAALGAAPAADAAYPGRNGQIAFEGRRSERGVLDMRAPNGALVRGLRAAGAGIPVAEPAFSPLGRRVAFTSRGALWIAFADGAAPRAVTAGAPGVTGPSWAPTADALAFSAGRRGARAVFRIGADGRGLQRLSPPGFDAHSPAWSSDGRLAFVRETRRSGGDLYVLDPSTLALRRLTRRDTDDRAPSWSPDGRALAFVRGAPGRRAIYVVQSGGAALRRLTDPRRDASSPAWSPAGDRIAFTMRDSRRRRQVFVMQPDGRVTRRLTSSSTPPGAPDWQPAGSDPIVAAAGDIACSPTDPFWGGGFGDANRCHQRQTSDVLLNMDLSAVLALGDLQYEAGGLSDFRASFDLTWGRLKPLIRPVPGNHEYRDPGATGYFDYFNGPGRLNGQAGNRLAGFYSFDVGDWHVVALNSQCSHPPGSPALTDCAPGSAQERWLRADLAANPRACTLAFWHHPLVSSGIELPNPAVAPLWQALADFNVDVLLAGHDHGYERFAPMDAAGVADPARGVRQFVVGTGGKSLQDLALPAPNSEMRAAAHGVLKLTLHPGGYDWQFAAEAGSSFSDAGSSACH